MFAQQKVSAVTVIPFYYWRRMRKKYMFFKVTSLLIIYAYYVTVDADFWCATLKNIGRPGYEATILVTIQHENNNIA